MADTSRTLLRVSSSVSQRIVHWPCSSSGIRRLSHSLCSFAAVNNCPISSCNSRLSRRSEEHTSELQSLMRISYAVFCLNKKKTKETNTSKKCEINRQTTIGTKRAMRNKRTPYNQHEHNL